MSTPTIVFRTGGGMQKGFGHVRRCLSLAESLHLKKAASVFLLDGGQIVQRKVASSGFAALAVRHEEDVSMTIELCRELQSHVVVVDSYEIKTNYFRSLANANLKVVVIDDLADRELPVDLVVNSSPGAEKIEYQGAPYTKYLMGSQYALLRQEFTEKPYRTINSQIRRVLITIGGTDPNGITLCLMRCVTEALDQVHLDVVIGPLFEDVGLIASYAKERAGTTTLHHDPKEMRSLMLSADLALCGGGQTTYELAACGTPSIGIRIADNQTWNLRNLACAGMLIWVADGKDTYLESKVIEALFRLANDVSLRLVMSKIGRTLVDGQGTSRVASAILELAGDVQA